MLLLVGDTLVAQNAVAPRQPLSSVAGQVVQESAGTPLRKVLVQLAPSEGANVFRQNDRESRQTLTDSEGRFVMQGVPPGEYSVVLARNGYLPSTRRSRHYSSALLTLAPGQDLEGLLFRMRPAGVIKGRVVDEDGDPMPEINVAAISTSSRDAHAGGTTNDLGEYRIAGLPEGKFLVLAQPQSEMFGSSEKPHVYVSTFYPGTLDAGQAAAVEVHAGDEATASFSLTRSRTFTVKGRVFGSTPRVQATQGSVAGPGSGIMLVRADSDDDRPVGGVVQENGTFEIGGVLPGSYNPKIFNLNGQQFRAGQVIEVRDADVEGIQLAVEPPIEVRGRFRMDDGSKPKWQQLQLTIDPDDPKQSDGPIEVRVEADGSFTTKNVQPGNYHIVVTSSSATFRDYIVKEVNVNGNDVGDSGFSVGNAAPFLDVVGSAKGSTIEGAAVDEDSKPVPNVPVICIPDVARRKRHDIYQQVQTDQRGYFSLRGLNAGEYQVFALDEAPGDITDPDFVSAHDGQGEIVTVEPGERKSIVLRLPPSAD
jgi:Carboxypeptidase regulatory-like domain